MSLAAAPHASRWAVYLRMGRISNLPTVWTNGLAGLLLAGATPEPGGLALLLLSVSAFYVGGRFLNDAFDADTDRQVRADRPIPSGQVDLAEVFTLGFGLLILGEFVLGLPALFGVGETKPLALGCGAVLGALIIYYDWRHRRDPFSPLVMALCRALIYGMAAATVLPAAQLPAHPLLGLGALALVCYLIGLTYIAQQENLTEVRNLWPLLFLAAPLLYRLPALGEGVLPAGLFLALAGWVVYSASFLVLPVRRKIPRAVSGLIAGIPLLDGVLIAGTGASPGWLAAAVAGFAATLLIQRLVPGTSPLNTQAAGTSNR